VYYLYATRGEKTLKQAETAEVVEAPATNL
jgi:hypothetical protein